MAINFPNSPSAGDTHVANNITWTYNGSSWRSNEGAGATVTVSDNPPSSPDSGDMWWESDTGKLKVYYNDGTSFQWVDASPQGSTEYINLSVSGSLNAGGVNVTGVTTTVNANVTGIITAANVDINGGKIISTDLDTANLNVTGVTTSVNVAVADSIGVGLYGQGTGIGITFESNGNATFSGIITAVAIQDPDGNSLGGGGGGGSSSTLIDSGNNVRVEANTTGAVVTGILTVTTNNYSAISGINVGMGGSVLPGTTTHDETNTGLGRGALYYARPGGAAPLEGKWNTGVGRNVLGFGTGGHSNTGVGAYALSGIGSTSTGVTAIGFNACYPNRGNNNTAVGTRTLQSNGKFDDVEFGPSTSPGEGNTAVGSFSLRDNIIGSWNVATGAYSCGLQTSGSFNTASGNSALYRNYSGSFGVAIGHNSQRWVNDTTTPWDNYNTSLGANALSFDSTNNTDSSGNTGNRNTAMGYGSLQNVTTGSRNTSLGMYCGQQITSGEDNTAVGYYTLEKITNGTWGQNNTAVGGQALGLSTSSVDNTAIGFYALRNSNGKYNTSVGAWSLSVGTASTENTAIGYASQEQTTVEGQFNTSVGAFALRQNTIGIKNVVMGGTALTRSKASSNNTAVGYAAGANYNDSTTASLGSNTFIGFSAAEGSATPSANTGIQNTVVGAYSLQLFTTGEHNTTMGFLSGNKLSTGNYNTLLGAYTSAGEIVTGERNTIVGYAAGYGLESGGYNVFVGHDSGYETDDGSGNTGIGYGALYWNRGNNGGTAVGYRSQYHHNDTNATDWNYNTSLGAYALEGSTSPGNNTGQYSTAVGSYALRLFSSGTHNTATGSFALNKTDGGSYNSGFGVNALYNNTAGSYNVAIGQQSLETNTTGDYNVAVGVYALQNANADGDYITAVGSFALRNINYAGGADITAIGYNAGSAAGNFANQSTYVGAWTGNTAAGGNRSNATCLGYGSNVNNNNEVQLGDYRTNTWAYGNAIQWRSDARDKTDIRDTLLGLDFIKSLRPVDFRWDYREAYIDRDPETHETTSVTKDGSRKRVRFHHGLIAQEVKAAADAQGVDFAGYQDPKITGGDDKLSIGYTQLIAPLIKSVQELSAENTALKARLDAAGL